MFSLYAVAIANYNVTAMLDATSASSPSVVERYSYTPYGEVTVLDEDFSPDSNNQSDIANTYLYTGRWRDPDTGLQLNRNRWYASHLGRWLTRDPIGYEGSEWNLYEYVGGMSTKYSDTSGLIGFDPPADWGPGGWRGPGHPVNPPSLEPNPHHRPQPAGPITGPINVGYDWPNGDEIVSAYDPSDNYKYPPDSDLATCHSIALGVAGGAGAAACAVKCIEDWEPQIDLDPNLPSPEEQAFDEFFNNQNQPLPVQEPGFPWQRPLPGQEPLPGELGPLPIREGPGWIRPIGLLPPEQRPGWPFIPGPPGHPPIGLN